MHDNRIRYRYVLTMLMFGVAAFQLNRTDASVIDSSGAGFSIPDDSVAGTSSVISVGVDETISDIEVTLFNANHTWVGDLIATITSPSGTTANLFFRVGGGFFGDSSNLNGNYTFGDSGGSWAAAVSSVGGNGTVASGTYQASNNGDGPFSLAATFAGESTLGDWTLNVSDNAGFDTGSIGGWGFNISSSPTAIPETGPLPLMTFLMGLAYLKRRRRPQPDRRS